ncbi:protein TOO MANY MOUTHS [Prunus yedoensis var. nudiflora]|uniref:Protein TOO MANY MOUTHS n=1 Tax=Prunus yedoensis var. nudiflora TaxID=2094558 RepID=A0A314Y3B3_PRUYE|nr:protein TOO MANY MOUTHS [Prunus yedoensis var. nudiflora]
MAPSEAEALFKIMESMSSDQKWRISHPNPCQPGSSWPGIECKLSLRSNPALVGPIPPQISTIKSLEILTLSQNRLTGPIPVEIFSLGSLVHLDMSYNMLTGTIPYQLGSLRNLQGLDLSYNMLTGAIPNTIGQLGLLQKFDFSSNSLTGGIPDGIEKLSLLVFMALSNNKLGGQFPKNNRLTGEIPVGFGSLSHIYHMNLSRNMLGGVVPFNSSFLKRLGRNLDLSGNPGLCLSPSEAHSLKIGVNVCGKNTNASSIQPWKKSQAPSGLSKPLFLFTALCVWGLPQMLLLV